MWPNHDLIDLLGLELPIIQAPMAGANGPDMAIEVCEAGGLGSLPCAMLDRAKAETDITIVRQSTDKPLNLNFFCHTLAPADPARDESWKLRLGEYYMELGLDSVVSAPAVSRVPFDESISGKNQTTSCKFSFWIA